MNSLIFSALKNFLAFSIENKEEQVTLVPLLYLPVRDQGFVEKRILKFRAPCVESEPGSLYSSSQRKLKQLGSY